MGRPGIVIGVRRADDCLQPVEPAPLAGREVGGQATARTGSGSSRGTPRTPNELAQHRMLIYNLSNQPHPLRFTRDGIATELPVHGVLEANDGRIIHNVVAGRLVRVLTEWELQRLTINIAYPTRSHLPAKVRCFVDFLVEQFAANDFERRWTA